MRFEQRGRRVIAADENNIGLECEQARDQCVHFFDDVHLARKIAILACRIGFLDMQIKEIEIAPILFRDGSQAEDDIGDAVIVGGFPGVQGR